MVSSGGFSLNSLGVSYRCQAHAQLRIERVLFLRTESGTQGLIPEESQTLPGM